MSLLLSKKAPLKHFNIIIAFKGGSSFHIPISCLSKPWKAYFFVWISPLASTFYYSQQNSDNFIFFILPRVF